MRFFQAQPLVDFELAQTGNTKDKIQFRLNQQLPIDNADNAFDSVGSRTSKKGIESRGQEGRPDHHHASLWHLQTPQLHVDEKQEERSGQTQYQQVLQMVPYAPRAQRNQALSSSGRRVGSCLSYLRQQISKAA